MTKHLYQKQLYEAALIRAVIALCLMSLVALFTAPVTRAQSKGSFPVAGERMASRTIWVVATAYSSEVAQTDDTPCMPANGYDLCEHYEKFGYANTVAANFLPMETQVTLPELFGDKVFVVRDRMNARYGPGRIDVWMPSKVQAQAFGVKYIKMEQYGGSQWYWSLARK